MPSDKKVANATSLAAISLPLKWHGGKHYLASRIVALMPPRCLNPNKPDAADPGWLHYVEPFAGGLSVLLANDPTGISEVVNDLSGALSNFWAVMQGMWFADFQRIVSTIPFSEQEFRSAGHPDAYYGHDEAGVNQAVAFFVRCRQSLAGRMKGFTGVTKTRTRRGMNNEVSAWLTCVEGLPAVHERLKRVLVLNRDALEVIRKHDGARTLFYLDPPYLHETRSTTGEYAHEMTEEQHEQLLVLLRGLEGKFLLSGYRSELYDDCAAANNWTRHDFDLPNNSAAGKTKERKTEVVWCNF